MLKKLAPAYRSMMINTHDSPIMDIFRQYEQQTGPGQTVKTPATATRTVSGP
jgi:hypothetical protein